MANTEAQRNFKLEKVLSSAAKRSASNVPSYVADLQERITASQSRERELLATASAALGQI